MRIPADRMIGAEGTGFETAMRTLDHTRVTIAAQAVGVAQGALDYALGYARERQQFGKPIADFQGLQFLLADMGMKVEAARQMTYAAAGRSERGDKDLTFFGAAAKCFASDVAMEVTTNAVQVLGGYGYTREYPVERMMRDAKITQIYEGTNQVQRIVMARQLLAGIQSELVARGSTWPLTTPTCRPRSTPPASPCPPARSTTWSSTSVTSWPSARSRRRTKRGWSGGGGRPERPQVHDRQRAERLHQPQARHLSGGSARRFGDRQAQPPVQGPPAPGERAQRDRQPVRRQPVEQGGHDGLRRRSTPESTSQVVRPASTTPSPPGVIGTIPRPIAMTYASSTRAGRISAPTAYSAATRQA